jgi:ATP-dependent Clp protease ATP-binding subunit ClpA
MNELEFTQLQTTPRWTKDLFRFLPIKSQFVLSGNIRDRFPFPSQDGRILTLELKQFIASALAIRGYRYFLSYNHLEGFEIISPIARDPQSGKSYNEEARTFLGQAFELKFGENGRSKASLEQANEIMERVSKHKDDFIAVMLDFASRYTVTDNSLRETENDFFTRALILSHNSVPHITSSINQAQFNPMIWIADRENDLPDWLVLDNPKLRSIIVPKPDHILRRCVVQSFAGSLDGEKDLIDVDKKKLHNLFVEQTESLTINDIVAIVQLCRREGLEFREIAEGIRRYKLGVTEDPWKKIDREKIRNGSKTIGERVKGQQQAVTKSMDIIKRAVTGLSGSQATKIGGKPRGVLFLAGPTGVGKTELAKSLTELLFGDEKAYIRFDMSEFSAEHADQRLIGAPPGYVGYESGGELTNAIKEKPFSVVLFDEIEKANPRILDKFLQLLDDGVLTSGRGERVYFSESVVIFTSNLGIYKEVPNGHGNRVPNVSSEDSYDDLSRKIRDEINSYFKLKLNRPEILNRIGENIIVFDFIRPDVAEQIFDKMRSNILNRLAEEQGIKIEIPNNSLEFLRSKCLTDLSNGGRGIGNQLEAWLVNPLARALFDMESKPGESYEISGVADNCGVPEIQLKGIGVS